MGCHACPKVRTTVPVANLVRCSDSALSTKRPEELAVRNCWPAKGVTILSFSFGECEGAPEPSAPITMNKYGSRCFGGRIQWLSRATSQQMSFNATCRKKLVNRKILAHQKKSDQGYGFVD